MSGDILPPMIVAIVACAVALAAVLLSALLTLSRLIRQEYQFHREEWEHDGKPIG